MLDSLVERAIIVFGMEIASYYSELWRKGSICGAVAGNSSPRNFRGAELLAWPLCLLPQTATCQS